MYRWGGKHGWRKSDLQNSIETFQRLAGRAHPGAERGPMRARVVVLVMKRMRDGLWIDQTAEEQEAPCHPPAIRWRLDPNMVIGKWPLGKRLP